MKSAVIMLLISLGVMGAGTALLAAYGTAFIVLGLPLYVLGWAGVIYALSEIMLDDVYNQVARELPRPIDEVRS